MASSSPFAESASVRRSASLQASKFVVRPNLDNRTVHQAGGVRIRIIPQTTPYSLTSSYFGLLVVLKIGAPLSPRGKLVIAAMSWHSR